MALTDMVCRTSNPGAKRRKLSDGGGLQLWVQTTGSRLWQLAYRFKGRQRQIALGPYPQVSLAEARYRREEIHRLLREGKDPAAQPTPEKAQATFKDVAEEFLHKREAEGIAAITLHKKRWLLDHPNAQNAEKRWAGI